MSAHQQGDAATVTDVTDVTVTDVTADAATVTDAA
jgi:hypothetical protein